MLYTGSEIEQYFFLRKMRTECTFQNYTPYNFRHSEPMLCHHLNPVDERLEEQRNKTKKKKKMRKTRRKSRRTTATSADTDPSAVATGMMTMTGLF